MPGSPSEKTGWDVQRGLSEGGTEAQVGREGGWGRVKADSGDGWNWYERSRWRGRPDPQLRSPITTLKSFLTGSYPASSSPIPPRHSSPDAFFYLGKIGDIKKLLICGRPTNCSGRAAIIAREEERTSWIHWRYCLTCNTHYQIRLGILEVILDRHKYFTITKSKESFALSIKDTFIRIFL